MTMRWLSTLSLIAVGCVTPPHAKPSLTSTSATAIDAYVRQRFGESDGVGLSVAVVKEGQLVLAQGYGSASLDGRVAVTPQTPFAIGSLTKQFTVAAILLLAERGKLAVSDPVSNWFPKLTRAADVTVLDLINHVSGYRDYYPLDFLDPRMVTPISTDEVIEQHAGGPLDFDPGSRFSYSNTGYLILGRIIEFVSGQPLGLFFKHQLFDPLSLVHTTFEPGLEPAFAQGHTRFALGPIQAARREAVGWLGAAAGIWSTPTDMVMWANSLATGKVLKPESLRLMTSPRRLTNGATSRYAGGLLTDVKDGELALTHTGSVNGFRAGAVFDLYGSAVAVFSNCDDFNPIGFAAAIFDALRHVVPAPRVAGPPPQEVATALFTQLQDGAVDRTKLSEAFSAYLSAERLKDASEQLRPFGAPSAVAVEKIRERGGFELALLRFTFGSHVLHATLFRRADGVVEEFLISRSQ